LILHYLKLWKTFGYVSCTFLMLQLFLCYIFIHWNLNFGCVWLLLNESTCFVCNGSFCNGFFCMVFIWSFCCVCCIFLMLDCSYVSSSSFATLRIFFTVYASINVYLFQSWIFDVFVLCFMFIMLNTFFASINVTTFRLQQNLAVLWLNKSLHLYASKQL
jgi:hypothetical protein